MQYMKDWKLIKEKMTKEEYSIFVKIYVMGILYAIVIGASMGFLITYSLFRLLGIV